MDPIAELAAVWGLETEFRDAFGKIRTVEPAVLALLLEAFPEGGKAPEMLPRSIVLRKGRDHTIRLNASAGVALRWSLHGEGRIVAHGQAVSPALTLPADVPNGIFRLDVALEAPSAPQEDASARACVVVCPAHAYQGRESAPRRVWCLAVQLYGVRSGRNWGHGDFGDLADLIGLAADLRAGGIALNPLHALFEDQPEHASPYSPSSRLFLNPLYIDVEAVPEFPGLEAAGLQDTVAALRDRPMVDYRAVADAKRHALRLAYEEFRRSGAVGRRAAFDRFRQQQGRALLRFAAFEVLRRKFNRPWWQWPSRWRRPVDAALDRLRSREEAEIGYWEFLQWLAHEQLEGCRDQAAERGLALGLYSDIAVGVRNDGFDCWCDQTAFLPRLSIGAPPDILNTAGQGWGLAGFSPTGLAERQFEPFARMLASAMQYAGAVRIDHVLGLKRLYFIPEGMHPAQGAYIRFPFEALLAVIALLSVERKCVVIGEDLGTVPDNFRETLADWGLWSYQVMMFERGADGTFHAPESYRENALVTFATHDLPTFAGWKAKHDLATKAALGIDPGETAAERDRALQALSDALEQRGMAFDFHTVSRYLAAAPSRLLTIALEDVMEVADQVNVPGTVDEHPNWRQRLPVPLEQLTTHAGLRALAHIMAEAGRAS